MDIREEFRSIETRLLNDAERTVRELEAREKLAHAATTIEGHIGTVAASASEFFQSLTEAMPVIMAEVAKAVEKAAVTVKVHTDAPETPAEPATVPATGAAAATATTTGTESAAPSSVEPTPIQPTPGAETSGDTESGSYPG